MQNVCKFVMLTTDTSEQAAVQLAKSLGRRPISYPDAIDRETLCGIDAPSCQAHHAFLQQFTVAE